jgi:hypothetical protein
LQKHVEQIYRKAAYQVGVLMIQLMHADGIHSIYVVYAFVLSDRLWSRVSRKPLPRRTKPLKRA